MGFRSCDKEGKGGYARLWKVEDKGNYSVAQLSTSRKKPNSEEYEVDFQDGYVRLVGSAHEAAKSLNITEKGVNIQITSCEVTNKYDSNSKKLYVNYVVFAFDALEGNKNSSGKSSSKTATSSQSKKPASKPQPKVETDEEDEDLPF